LLELLKVHDIYESAPIEVEAYDPERLNILKGSTKAQPLADRLVGDAAAYLREPGRYIEMGAVELEHSIANGGAPPAKPYWDKVLASDRGARVRFLRQLASLGLGVFCRKARGYMGIFFIRKKTGMQRMILDARFASACHRKPPACRLGTPAALGRLDLSDEALRAGGLEPASALHAVGIDLVDCFYQYNVLHMCDWFACERAEPASVWEVTEAWDPSAGRYDAVDPSTQLYFCFSALPMGWSWSLFFAQSAMTTALRTVFPQRSLGSAGLVGGLLEDASVAPLVGKSAPVCAVYVDNATIVAESRAAAAAAAELAKGALRRVGLVIGDYDPPTQHLRTLGLELDLAARKLSHQPRRAWAIYGGCRALLHMGGATFKMIEVFLGHLVNYFLLARPGLVAIQALYKFKHASFDKGWCRFAREVFDELLLIMGLVFVCGVRDLGLPFADQVYCGDASLKGYAVGHTTLDAEEVRQLCLVHERWRFQAVPPEAHDVEDSLQPWEPRQLAAPCFEEWATALDRRFVDKEKLKPKGWDRRRAFVPAVGAVPVLPPVLSVGSSWKLVVQKAWEHKEPIHLLESRVELFAVRHAARSNRLRGAQVLTLSDNLASVLAHEAGRARNHALRRLVARGSAYQLAVNMIWRHRYIHSEVNPLDHASRAADRGELSPPSSGVTRRRGSPRISPGLPAGVPARGRRRKLV